MGKKLIRVDYAKGAKGPYSVSYPAGSVTFAFAGPEMAEKDGIRTRTQISNFVTCRDQLCMMPWHSRFKTDYSNLFYGSKFTLDPNALRLLIGARPEGTTFTNVDAKEVKARIFSAKRAMELICEHAGWSAPTITTVKHAHETKGEQTYLFTGPKQLMHCPQMISLTGLIFRVARKNGRYNTDSLDSVIQNLKEIGDSTDPDVRANNGDDLLYLRVLAPNLKKLLENFDKVFEGKSEDYVPRNTSAGLSGYGGILALLRKKTGNIALHKRVQHYVLRHSKK